LSRISKGVKVASVVVVSFAVRESCLGSSSYADGRETQTGVVRGDTSKGKLLIETLGVDGAGTASPIRERPKAEVA
jgi:hypothetical protein